MRNYDEKAYIVKIDIQKFFYSIDRGILINILRKKIRCEKTLSLLIKIIDSSPGELGLPLGNLTSQLLANIYLDQLDQFVKRRLGVKYYVRYADDVIMIVENKQKAKELLKVVTEFLKEDLNLIAHPAKSRIQPLILGTESLGFKIFYTHILLNRRTKNSIKRFLRNVPKYLRTDTFTVKEIESRLNTWLAHARHANSAEFIFSLTKKFNYLYIDHKNLLRISAIYC